MAFRKKLPDGAQLHGFYGRGWGNLMLNFYLSNDLVAFKLLSGEGFYAVVAFQLLAVEYL